MEGKRKTIRKVFVSTSGLYGSIKGIAGSSIGDIPLLDDGIEEEDDAPKLLIHVSIYSFLQHFILFLFQPNFHLR